ncbi:hypothetical protein Tco_0311746 [Tanacetum coccineum]
MSADCFMVHVEVAIRVEEPRRELPLSVVLFFPTPRFCPLGFTWKGFLRSQVQLDSIPPNASAFVAWHIRVVVVSSLCLRLMWYFSHIPLYLNCCAAPGTKSILNSTCRAGGIPDKSSRKTSGKSRTIGTSSSRFSSNLSSTFFALWKLLNEDEACLTIKFNNFPKVQVKDLEVHDVSNDEENKAENTKLGNISVVKSVNLGIVVKDVIALAPCFKPPSVTSKPYIARRCSVTCFAAAQPESSVTHRPPVILPVITSGWVGVVERWVWYFEYYRAVIQQDFFVRSNSYLMRLGRSLESTQEKEFLDQRYPRDQRKILVAQAAHFLDLIMKFKTSPVMRKTKLRKT